MSDSAFELLHPGLQKAIYALGWTKLRSIQTLAIRLVLESSDHAILCAQTASGKTEAAFLPILSRLAESPGKSVRALYVGPLKALINDQFRRLEQLCEVLDIPVHRWHGDVSAADKKRFRHAPGGVLLITPESLESNFINYGAEIRRLYADLDFVVIDELHSFLPGVRGIHLRSLLARLRQATGRFPRMLGLSATLGDPLAARAFIAPGSPGTVQVLTEEGAARELRVTVRAYLSVPNSEGERRETGDEIVGIGETLNAEAVRRAKPLGELARILGETEAPDEFDDIAQDIAGNFRESTNLVFGNSKQSLEILADRLHRDADRESWPHDPFIVHHGSLAKDLRLEAEELLKSGRPTTALCSSTLEMGIDIGAVRSVGQVDPPRSVASLVQRIGRSGRREGEPAILRMYVREDSPRADSTVTGLLFPDLLRAIALVRLVVAKWLEPADVDRMHLSTLVHQVLSLLRQTGGMRADKMHDALIGRGPFRAVSPVQFSQLLRDLAAAELIEQVPQGELILAPKGELITGAHDFYAAFDASDEFSVRHGDFEIGKLASSLIPPVGENLILAGRRWQVDQIEARAKCAFVTPTRGGKPPVFRGDAGVVHSRIVQEMKAVLRGNDLPIYLNTTGKQLLGVARRVGDLTGAARAGILRRESSVQWFPWIGTLGLRTLALHAKAARIECTTDSLSISYKVADDFIDLRAHWRDIAENRRPALELASLMSVKSFEKFDSLLSDGLLDAANSMDQLDMKSAQSAAVLALQQ